VQPAPLTLLCFDPASLTTRYNPPVRLCSFSVDLDEIACYSAIHGLATDAECHAVFDLALGRILDFAARQRLPLTLFVIARDLERERNVEILRRAVRQGHEIGNHSLDHLYDLTKRERPTQKQQVAEASDRIETLLDVRPKGFRAPGYTMSETLMTVLQESGLSYDASVFPCPVYYAAKAAALVGMRMRGRVSKSVVDAPGVLRAPTIPYCVGTPYWTRGSKLLELPIQVVGPLRLPFIGTALTLIGPLGAQLLSRALVGTRFINLELHGIDFLEGSEVPTALRAVQPDLRVPLTRKLQVFETVLNTLRTRGYSAVRMDEAARIFAQS